MTRQNMKIQPSCQKLDILFNILGLNRSITKGIFIRFASGRTRGFPGMYTFSLVGFAFIIPINTVNIVIIFFNKIWMWAFVKFFYSILPNISLQIWEICKQTLICRSLYGNWIDPAGVVLEFYSCGKRKGFFVFKRSLNFQFMLRNPQIFSI